MYGLGIKEMHVKRFIADSFPILEKRLRARETSTNSTSYILYILYYLVGPYNSLSISFSFSLSRAPSLSLSLTRANSVALHLYFVLSQSFSFMCRLTSLINEMFFDFSNNSFLCAKSIIKRRRKKPK